MVSSMVLGAETPVNIWEDRLVFKVFCSEDTAAYLLSLLALIGDVSEKRGLSAFSTYLSQNNGFFNTLRFKAKMNLRSAFCG